MFSNAAFVLSFFLLWVFCQTKSIPIALLLDELHQLNCLSELEVSKYDQKFTYTYLGHGVGFKKDKRSN